MKNLPVDKEKGAYIKIPFKWIDLINEISDESAGRLLLAAIDYAFRDLLPDAILTQKELAIWMIMKQDIDYQCEHHHSYCYQEPNNQDDRFTKEYKLWREAVYQRDNFTCQACGQKGGELNAHHIKAYALYPDLRTSIENGVTLCKDCHKAVHRGEIKCPTVY